MICLPAALSRVFRRPLTTVALTVAAGAVLASCGGGDQPTQPPPPPPVLAERLRVQAPAVQLEVGDTSVLSTTFTRTVGGATTVQTTNPAAATYQSSNPALATVSVTSGVARVVAVAPGSVTITASLDTLRASVELVLTASSVTAARFTANALVIPAGVAVTPGVELLGRTGQPVQAPYTLAVAERTGANPSVQVAGGSITASAGTRTAMLVLSVGARLDTLSLLIASSAPATGGAQPVSLERPYVRAGLPFVVQGADAATTDVRVGGVSATRTNVSATAASFTLPEAPFGACLPGGATLPVRITTPAGEWALDMPALHPHRMTIATNDVQYPFAAVAQGCLVAVDAGTYDVQFYRWDLDFDRVSFGKNPAAPYAKSAAEPVALWQRRLDRVTELDAPPVSVGGASVVAARAVTSPDATSAARAHATGAAPAAIRAQFARAATARRTGRGVGSAQVLADFTQPTWRSASGGSCAIPTTVGDSLLLFTERQNGRVQYLPGDPRATSVEPWVLAGVSSRVAVFVDTTFARTQLPTSRVAIEQFVAAYDSTVVTWFASQGLAIPDADGTGRMVVLLPDMVGPATSLSRYYGRPDCAFASAPVGEAIAIPGGFSTAGVASRLNVAVHEVLHVLDIAGPGRSAAPGRQMWWVQEGFAALGEWLWAYAPAGDALNARATGRQSPRVIHGSAATPTCARPTRAQLGAWFTMSGPGYDLACQFLAWTVRGGVQGGVSQGAVLSRLVMAQDKSTMRDVLVAVRGTSGEDFPRVIGDFFAAFAEPSAGAVPRADLLFGPINLGAYVASIPYTLMTPVSAGNGLPPVRDHIGEVDLQVMRVSSAQELLLDIRVNAAAVPSRMGVGVRRR